jgi:RNA polymerase sigma factor (sigma-70 family)
MDQTFPRSDDADVPPRTELQRRIDNGEVPRRILEELCARLQPRLRSHVRKSIQDMRDAEDLVQTVFLKMNANFDDMIAREPADSWVFRVANNAVTDYIRRKKKSPLLVEPEAFEHDWTDRTRPVRVEDQAETWVVSVEPVLAHMRALVARGSLSTKQLKDYWYEVAEGVTQRELARDAELTQGRISQRKSALELEVRVSLYLCEILGLVRTPYLEADIRSHLDLFDLATCLNELDRELLRRAGGAVRRDFDRRPVLRRRDAETAIQTRQANRVVTLDELHDSESRYAAAIPNRTPHCIATPCTVHTASRAR